MWSGPRNLSTAMMRSFGARADMSVMDEPFFAPFLDATGKAHPGRDETLATHPTDPKIVAAACAAKPITAHSFQKHMPHHMLPDFPTDWMESRADNEVQHFFLIREPARVIASYAKGRAAFDLDDLGFAPQLRLWEELGRPPVIDSQDILRAPEPALRTLCAAINLSFDPAMLSWEAGSRTTDGAWAPYWYASVEASTGFSPAPATTPNVPHEYADILAACEADYAALKAAALPVPI
ncbi:HAD family hydrolase [Litorimonas sp. RW-G-Af-16]|uniref:sulfotransferase-like domain-containing protein n=1 Tax=Litorimonas sp. RW-G-Af-16 TaxID=3241168 RepID=UPI00390CD3DD